jgi:signal transduction histidine kinase
MEQQHVGGGERPTEDAARRVRPGVERRAQAGADADAHAHAAAQPGQVADALLDLVERSPIAIAVVCADTQEVRYANAAFLALTAAGASPGCQASSLLPRQAAEAVTSLLDEVRRTNTPRTDVEVAGTGPDGEPRTWCVTIWRAAPRAPRRDDLVLQMRDVTRDTAARQRTAALMDQLRDINTRLVTASLRESELAMQAQAASQAKSTFLATMSHELRTPLTAIIGYEELLADGLFGPVSDLQRRHLARIKLSAKHLLALIDQILALARVEAGREVVLVEEVTVAELADWAATIIEPLAQAKGLTFVTRASADAAGARLRTDATKVRQILVNLLGNAVKFTDHGAVTLSVQRRHEAVAFVIRDTGIGIAPADIDRVFDSFWQVEQRPTRMAGGSGLGLSVSRQLARLLGGDVTVESEPGAGSTFTVTLPLDGPQRS